MHDKQSQALLAPLADADNTCRATAERAVNERLNGSCQTPIAAYATLDGDNLHLRSLVGSPDGSIILYSEQHGAITAAHALGTAVADDLLAQGAQAILDNLQSE